MEGGRAGEGRGGREGKEGGRGGREGRREGRGGREVGEGGRGGEGGGRGGREWRGDCYTYSNIVQRTGCIGLYRAVSGCIGLYRAVSGCIDLVFVSRHHSHLVVVSVVGSLEKKHQHVSIIFKIVADIADHRSKAIRRINPDVLQCSFVPSLFDYDQ